MLSLADDELADVGCWRLSYAGHDLAPPPELAPRLAVGNGLVGVVGASALCAAPETRLAGLFGETECGRALIALPAADVLGVTIDGAPLPQACRTTAFTHVLDMRGGALELHWRAPDAVGALAGLSSRRLASLADRRLQVSVTRLDFRAAADVEIQLQARAARTALVLESPVAGVEAWRAPDSPRRAARASRVELVVGAGAPKPLGGDGWSWRAAPGGSLSIVCLSAAARADDAGDDAGVAACDALAKASAAGWRAADEDHRQAWSARWRLCDVEVDGDEVAQRALRFAGYHLVSAANPDDAAVSIGARGLTGPTYQGHVFWDTAIYLLPFYSFTWPAAARAIVMYRYRTLDAARAKAARLGWRGAFYAWESADTGDEVAPERSLDAKGAQVPIRSGRDEAHVSADVAYAVWRYWRASGDDDLLLEAGAEILLETARFWASRAERDAEGRWHIRHVEGPDEYHQDVDDNAFTNAMARWNLQRGLEIAELVPARWPTRWRTIRSKISLDDQELSVWREVAEGLESCFDARRGLYEQFAGYFDLEAIDPRPYTDGEAPIDVALGPERVQNSQVIKQADVVEMLALLPGDPPDVVGANLDYYEARCAHGSSLSLVTHALVAARLGRADQALSRFHQAVETDLGAPTHLSCGGVRFATLGGLWQTAIFGFAGVSEDRDGLRLEPQLPARWRRLAFRLQWRGRTLRVCVEPGGVSVALEAGAPLEVAVGGERRTVGRDEPARFETPA